MPWLLEGSAFSGAIHFVDGPSCPRRQVLGCLERFVVQYAGDPLWMRGSNGMEAVTIRDAGSVLLSQVEPGLPGLCRCWARLSLALLSLQAPQFSFHAWTARRIRPMLSPTHPASWWAWPLRLNRPMSLIGRTRPSDLRPSLEIVDEPKKDIKMLDRVGVCPLCLYAAVTYIGWRPRFCMNVCMSSLRWAMAW
ncbi:hypothetical protein D9M68_109650 [compost metagenome]